MKKWTVVSVFVLMWVCILAFTLPKDIDTLKNKTVGDILIALGDEKIKAHLPKKIRGAVDTLGQQLVIDGKTKKPWGGKTKRVSPYFDCTACHNIVKESNDLTDLDPAKKLAYAKANGIPYVPGSPLYGIVSRYTFYNEDYVKKYGDLVDAARNDLRGAIQLCATECSQGRALKDWEMEAVISYLWTIDIPFDELQLSKEERSLIKEALKSEENQKKARDLIRSKYITSYPADFVDPPADRIKGNEEKGNIADGEDFYTLSCLHCHKNNNYSLTRLDKSKFTLRQLAKRMPTYHEQSVYQVGRYGTSPLSGKGAYMPNYTLEKMSRKQMADLRAYFESHMK